MNREKKWHLRNDDFWKNGVSEQEICPIIFFLFFCVVFFFFPLLFVANPAKITRTETTYGPTQWNLSENDETPIFCGFIQKDKNVTPIPTVQHEEELSFLMECVDPKFNPNKHILGSFESEENKKSDGIF